MHTIISLQRRLEQKVSASLWTCGPGEEEGRAASGMVLGQNGEKYLSQGCPLHLPSLCNKEVLVEAPGKYLGQGPQNGST